MSDEEEGATSESVAAAAKVNVDARRVGDKSFWYKGKRLFVDSTGHLFDEEEVDPHAFSDTGIFVSADGHEYYKFGGKNLYSDGRGNVYISAHSAGISAEAAPAPYTTPLVEDGVPFVFFERNRRLYHDGRGRLFDGPGEAVCARTDPPKNKEPQDPETERKKAEWTELGSRWHRAKRDKEAHAPAHVSFGDASKEDAPPTPSPTKRSRTGPAPASASASAPASDQGVVMAESFALFTRFVAEGIGHAVQTYTSAAAAAATEDA